MAGAKGRSGRLPKPTALLRLQGTDRKDRHHDRRKGEPPLTGDGSLPSPPEGLKEDVRAAWEELGESIKFRIFSREDLTAFRTFATMWATWKKLADHIDREGVTAESEMKDGRVVMKLSPEASMWSDLNGKLLQYFARFGMTPSDRTRVRELAGVKDNGQEDPDDEFSKVN